MNTNNRLPLYIVLGLFAISLILKWTCRLIFGLLDYAIFIGLTVAVVWYIRLPKYRRQHLTNQNAQDIVGRIDRQAQQKTCVRSLPLRQKDYTPEIITAISHILSVDLSRFNVGTGHGLNREWEVGHKSPYDDLDTRMSGTKMSM